MIRTLKRTTRRWPRLSDGTEAICDTGSCTRHAAHDRYVLTSASGRSARGLAVSSRYYAFLAGRRPRGNDAESKLALAEANRLIPQFTFQSFSVLPPPIIADAR
jgi:hypothetical protein